MKNLVLLLIPGFIYSYQIDLKAYYYNLNDFQEPKIYEYQSSDNSINMEYWKVTSDTINKELITETFDSEFNLTEYFKEKFERSGSQMVAFSIIEDSIMIKSTPIRRDVYLWNTSESYSYSLKYNSKFGEIYFEKTRTYQGLEKIRILDKTYDAIKLRGDYVFKIIDEDQTYKYFQYSYYVKDLGFVKYKRVFEDHSQIELNLSNIYSEQEWNNLKK